MGALGGMAVFTAEQNPRLKSRLALLHSVSPLGLVLIRKHAILRSCDGHGSNLE